MINEKLFLPCLLGYLCCNTVGDCWIAREDLNFKSLSSSTRKWLLEDNGDTNKESKRNFRSSLSISNGGVSSTTSTFNNESCVLNESSKESKISKVVIGIGNSHCYFLVVLIVSSSI